MPQVTVNFDNKKKEQSKGWSKTFGSTVDTAVLGLKGFCAYYTSGEITT